MKIRDKPIYLTTEVWRWLWLLSKAESVPEENRITTADEIADQLLRQAIREQHPQLSDHQDRIDKLEKELVKELRMAVNACEAIGSGA